MRCRWGLSGSQSTTCKQNKTHTNNHFIIVATYHDAVSPALALALPAAPRPRQELLVAGPTTGLTQHPWPLLQLVLVRVGGAETYTRLSRPRDGRQHEQPQAQHTPLPPIVVAAGPPARR